MKTIIRMIICVLFVSGIAGCSQGQGVSAEANTVGVSPLSNDSIRKTCEANNLSTPACENTCVKNKNDCITFKNEKGEDASVCSCYQKECMEICKKDCY